jgi:alginate O-acetyltransferase complex protein AlgI
MLFNTPEFIFVFLPAALALHFALARWSVEAAVIGTGISSLVFYAWWNPPFLFLPIASVAGNFWLARLIARSESAAARCLFLLGIAGNVGVLAYYKYGDFLASILTGDRPAAANVPLALSFITFVQITFLADAYRRRVPLDFARYALFATFFPHLVAGPIVRWADLGRQIMDPARYRWNWSNAALGLTVFTLGLGKKVLIADQLAPHVAPVFDAAVRGEPVMALAAWGAALAFSAQVYFDFSGYSDMAIGLGLLFNYRLPVNFAAPFRATNLLDFWRRWHITLSHFLRDFVYAPLSGGRPNRWRQAAAVFLTMVVAGVWHGAGWTFVVWGAYHGLLLLINIAWQMRPGFDHPTVLGKLAGWALTFTAFVVGAVFFRAADIATSWQLLAAMTGQGGASVPEALTLTFDLWMISKGYVSEAFVRSWFGATWTMVATITTLVALAIALLVPDTMELVDYREGEIQSRWRRSLGALAWQPSLFSLVAILAIFVLVFLRIGEVTEFIYYQF